MSKEVNKSEIKTYVGKVVADVLKIGTKKPKTYKKGDIFKTENKTTFETLINLKKIKKQ